MLVTPRRRRAGRALARRPSATTSTCSSSPPTAASARAFHGPGGERLLGGLPPGDDPVADWTRALHPDDRAAFEQHLRGLLGGESTDDVVRLVGLRRRHARDLVAELALARRDGVVVHGIAADVTCDASSSGVLKADRRPGPPRGDALEARAAEAERLARTDALTGVANRRHLSERLEHALRARRGRRPPGCCCSTSTTSSASTTRYGHAAGDAVLVEVARRHPRRRPRRDARRALGRRGVLRRSCRGVRTTTRPARIGEGVRARDRAPTAIDVGRRRARGHRLGRRRPRDARAARRSTTSSTPPTARSTRRSAAAATRRASTASLDARGPRRRGARGDPASPRRLALTASVREGMSPLHCAAGRRPRRARPPSGSGLPERDRAALPARRLAARRRQGRDPRRASSRKRGPLDDASWDVMRAHTRDRRRDHPPDRRPARGGARPSATTTSTATAAATRTAWSATRSRSRRASSPPPTPTRR